MKLPSAANVRRTLSFTSHQMGHIHVYDIVVRAVRFEAQGWTEIGTVLILVDTLCSQMPSDVNNPPDIEISWL